MNVRLATMRYLFLSRSPIHGNAKIGHHLHVWSTPPFQNGGKDGIDHQWIHAFQFQLPDSLFMEKAERLRSAIEASFGKSPTSHRAGRWGVDQRTVDWLVGAGFVVDTSIRTGFPLTKHEFGNRTIDSSREPVACTEYDMRKNPYLWTCKINATTVAPHLWKYLRPYQSRMDWSPGSIAISWYRVERFEPLLLRVIRKLGGRRMLRPNPNYASGRIAANHGPGNQARSNDHQPHASFIRACIALQSIYADTGRRGQHLGTSRRGIPVCS